MTGGKAVSLFKERDPPSNQKAADIDFADSIAFM